MSTVSSSSVFIRLIKQIWFELYKTIKRPWRIINIFSSDAVKSYMQELYRQKMLVIYGENWQSCPDTPGFTKRQFKSYDDYVSLQQNKLRRLLKYRADLMEKQDKYFHAVLLERLKPLQMIRPGTNVLCLAARLGTEVRAFLDLGCFAVGLDLNPGKDNKNVLYGDFHNIQFPDGVVDVVYSNSLDHTYDMDLFLGEVTRVLKSDGRAIFEVGSQGVQPSFHESMAWSSPEDVTILCNRHHLTLVEKYDFTAPWLGVQLIFCKNIPKHEQTA